MEVLTYEKRWSEEQEWKEAKYSVSSIKSQADLISFLQAVGQSRWFKGHDRSKFHRKSDERKNHLIAIIHYLMA